MAVSRSWAPQPATPLPFTVKATLPATGLSRVAIRVTGWPKVALEGVDESDRPGVST